MKDVANKIHAGPNRALALAVLARCAHGAEAAKLAWAALAEGTDNEFRGSDLIGLPDLLSAKQIARANRTVKGSLHPIGRRIQLLQQEREGSEPEQARSFRASIAKGDYEAALKLWIGAAEAVNSYEGRRVLPKFTADLTALAEKDRDTARSFWREALDVCCRSGRPSVIAYLRSSLPLLTALITLEELPHLVDDVLDMCSWGWL